MSNCPVHSMLRKLRIFAGLPVPFITKWVDDKPDFRDADVSNWLRCVNERLCQVCGKPLRDRAFYIGGPKSFDSHLFLDPPMHETCARESMRLCPFLNGTRRFYRGDDIETPNINGIPLMDISKRPDIMYLMKGWAAAMRLASIDRQPAIYAGALRIVEEF